MKTITIGDKVFNFYLKTNAESYIDNLIHGSFINDSRVVDSIESIDDAIDFSCSINNNEFTVNRKTYSDVSCIVRLGKNPCAYFKNNVWNEQSLTESAQKKLRAEFEKLIIDFLQENIKGMRIEAKESYIKSVKSNIEDKKKVLNKLEEFINKL